MAAWTPRRRPTSSSPSAGTMTKTNTASPASSSARASAPGGGTHGTFSHYDIHNTFVAGGPDIRTGYRDELPTGNIDVAPTILAILGLEQPGGCDDRVLYEGAERRGLQRPKPETKPHGSHPPALRAERGRNSSRPPRSGTRPTSTKATRREQETVGARRNMDRWKIENGKALVAHRLPRLATTHSNRPVPYSLQHRGQNPPVSKHLFSPF